MGGGEFINIYYFSFDLNPWLNEGRLLSLLLYSLILVFSPSNLLIVWFRAGDYEDTGLGFLSI